MVRLFSNTLACLNGLAEDAHRRNVLGPDVEICLHTYDETTRPAGADYPRYSQGGRKALIGLVGVQSNQFPRAVDLARPFLAAGLPVCIGGFHISGCISMLPELPPTCVKRKRSVSRFFAGEAEEGRFDVVFRDAWRGNSRRSIITWTSSPFAWGAPAHPATKARAPNLRFALEYGLGRGCAYQCPFCTIIMCRLARVHSVFT